MPAHPFGAPDAASADLDLDAQYETFVNIDGTITKDHEAALPRVVFGRKGSGKSHYLRALNALKAGDHSVLAFGPSTDPPTHEWVIRLSLALQQRAVPRWGDLWKQAILASAAVTLLYNGRRAEPAVGETFSDQLERAAKVVLGSKGLPNGYMTPFGAAQQILSRAKSLERFDAILNLPQWQELENALEPVLAGSPPLFFFLDNLDAAEAYAPRPWQSCQRGLLDAILSLAEDPRWKRIHVVVALKDTVVQSLFDSWHGHKYVHSPMLHRLEWSTEQSQAFLRWKIDALPEMWRTGTDGSQPTARWLARETVANTARACSENIEAYLLRHTLLLPRDIVEMGNCLCDSIAKARARGRAALTNDEVRAAVNRAARQIGKTGVYSSGVEVARGLMPSDAPLHGAGEAFGIANGDPHGEGEDDMTFAISEQYAFLLTRGLKRVGRDRFDTNLLQLMKDAISQDLPQATASDQAMGALWRLGMIGVIDGELEAGEARFYGHSEHDGSNLPEPSGGFAFHPSMIDYLGEPNVAAIGDPVYPEPGFLSALGL